MFVLATVKGNGHVKCTDVITFNDSAHSTLASFDFFVNLNLIWNEYQSGSLITDDQKTATLSFCLSPPRIISHATIPRRTALPTMPSVASPTEHELPHDNTTTSRDVILLSGYPFYLHGVDPSAVQAVFENTRSVLKDRCGEQLVSVQRIGSSAIAGMAGTPVCDIVAEVSPWPLHDATKAKLAKAGYECHGRAPHATEHDEWFFGGDGKPGHVGRVVVHTVPIGSEFIRETRAFCEYVNSHPEAFERYNTVKVEGAILMSKSEKEEGRLIGYKHKKAQVCVEIMHEAIQWWSETKGNNP